MYEENCEESKVVKREKGTREKWTAEHLHLLMETGNDLVELAKKFDRPESSLRCQCDIVHNLISELAGSAPVGLSSKGKTAMKVFKYAKIHHSFFRVALGRIRRQKEAKAETIKQNKKYEESSSRIRIERREAEGGFLQIIKKLDSGRDIYPGKIFPKQGVVWMKNSEFGRRSGKSGAGIDNDILEVIIAFDKKKDFILEQLMTMEEEPEKTVTCPMNYYYPKSEFSYMAGNAHAGQTFVELSKMEKIS